MYLGFKNLLSAELYNDIPHVPSRLKIAAMDKLMIFNCQD